MGAINTALNGLSYLPNPNFNGLDGFTFKANDGLLDSAPATISITVTPANDAPTLANALADQAGTFGTAFNISLPANTFTDVDAGQTLSYSATGLPPGIMLHAATGTLSGIPTQAGSFAAVLRANDDATPALSASGAFTIAIAKAALTLTANDTARDYGQPNPPLTGTLAGIVNNDPITATFSTTATPASTVVEYPILPNPLNFYGKLANYTVTRSADIGCQILRRWSCGPDQESRIDEITFAGAADQSSRTTWWMGFGDGSPAVIGTRPPTHVFTKHGVYTVRLTVTDSQPSASDTVTVTVISSYGCT